MMKEADQQFHEVSKSEIILTPELNITPEAIRQDNDSEIAEQRNEEFTKAKKEGELVLEWGCIDWRRRRKRITRTMLYETIAAAGNPAKIERAINDPRIEFVTVESHHGTEKIGESPGECAGRDAKNQEMKNGTRNADGEGLGAFISNEIKHSDVILQASINGAIVSSLTEKPVVVSTQHHRTGESKVISISQRNGSIIRTQSAILNQQLLYQDQYSPEELYANGIPFIPLNKIENDQVREYFEESANELKKIKEKDPDYEKKHILHNPDMMAIVTDLRSMEIILPTLGQSAIRLTVPRSQKLDDKSNVNFDFEDLKKAWAQAEYVMTQAAKNYSHPDKSFSKTKTIFMATPNYEQAKDLTLDLTSRQFMLPWLALPDRRIIIGETRAGRITAIGQLTYEYNQNRLVNPKDVVYWKKN